MTLQDLTTIQISEQLGAIQSAIEDLAKLQRQTLAVLREIRDRGTG